MSAQQLRTFIRCYLDAAEMAAVSLGCVLEEYQSTTQPAERLELEPLLITYEQDFERNSDAAIELLYCL